ncbi:MAG: DUF2953 domain-containing protein [Clostridia bacterium]|nr:DUF2953 domain-containing protein [Clostridia bacterium]
MKIVLIVLGVILALLLALLFLPLTVDLSYKQKFVLKVKFSGITIFDNQKKSKRKPKSKKPSAAQDTETKKQPKDNFLKKTYKQKGLIKTIKYFAEILTMLFKKFFWVIKHFKFRKFSLDLVVATPDAANTAIQYGGICSAVYPIIAFLQSNTDFKAKAINISTDFDKIESEFSIAFSVTTRLFFWIIATISAFFNFSKIQRKEREKYERK